MSKLFIIIGKTGSGKSTVVNSLLSAINYYGGSLTRLVMYTTRPKRPHEVDGEEYHFIDVDTFMKKIQAGELLEHRTYETDNGYWHYATPKFENDDTNYILAGTLEMYKTYVALFDIDVVPILLVRDEYKRVHGLINRELTDNPHPDLKEVYRRLYTDEIDFKDVNDIIPKENTFPIGKTLVEDVFSIHKFIENKLKEES